MNSVEIFYAAPHLLPSNNLQQFDERPFERPQISQFISIEDDGCRNCLMIIINAWFLKKPFHAIYLSINLYHFHIIHSSSQVHTFLLLFHHECNKRKKKNRIMIIIVILLAPLWNSCD